MAKLSFKEWLQVREEYNEYLNDSQPEEKKELETKKEPEEKKEPKEEPAPEENKEPEDPVAAIREEMAAIKEGMALMAKALQPSLGDIKPVGIDDVVSKFFNDNEEE